MTDTDRTVYFGVVVEEEVQFTLLELGRACRVEGARLVELVAEGVLTPRGAEEQDWQFDGAALRRARAALRLSRDFELSAAHTAFVLDLLDQIEALKAQLRQVGAG